MDAFNTLENLKAWIAANEFLADGYGPEIVFVSELLGEIYLLQSDLFEEV